MPTGLNARKCSFLIPSRIKNKKKNDLKLYIGREQLWTDAGRENYKRVKVGGRGESGFARDSKEVLMAPFKFNRWQWRVDICRVERREGKGRSEGPGNSCPNLSIVSFKMPRHKQALSTRGRTVAAWLKPNRPLVS